MSSRHWLDEQDRVRFSDAVEASFAVSSRQQFFVWSQSTLQSLIPHEILICGIDDGSRQGMSVHRFSASRYFRQEHFDVIADPLHGLLPKLMAVAEKCHESTLFSPRPEGSPSGPADAGLLVLVEGNEMKNLAARLVHGTRGKVEAFYVFSRISRALDDRLGYFTELMVPHVHLTFLRVLGAERDESTPNTQRAGRLVTPRQEEILNLIKNGKTNAEIAELLSCSPWTIKNHIQAILRKLGSNTRTHAISRAMTLGILTPD